jgi:hypothetical protein
MEPRSCLLPTEYGFHVPPSREMGTICFGRGDERALGHHVRVQARPRAVCMSARQRGAVLVGWATRYGFACRRCGCNAHNALCTRHGLAQPLVTGSLAFALAVFQRVFVAVRGCFDTHSLGGFDGWLSKWNTRKQQDFLQSIQMDQVLPAKVKAMIKFESGEAFPSRPRLIQMYPNKATQAAFGPVFYALQKAVMEVFNRLSLDALIDLTFASGMNNVAIADWMETNVAAGCTHFYERDGKNWDSTMQAIHLNFRDVLYDSISPDLGVFARACRGVQGWGLFLEGVLKYFVYGTVKSGHNDTTLGNCLINGAITYECFRHLGQRCSIIVAGDDLLVAVWGDFDANLIIARERALGIIPVARKFRSPFDVSFISGVFIGDGERIHFTPKPGRLISRLWWAVNPPKAQDLPGYHRGVARGLLPACSGLPVVRVWLHRADTPGAASIVDWVVKSQSYEGHQEWGDGVLEHFAARYGVGVCEVLDCERWLEGLPFEPAILSHPVLDAIMRVDLADLMTRPENLLRL